MSHQPRPFWIKGTAVQAFSQQNQYGNPSGHSSIAACVMTAIALDLYYWLKPSKIWQIILIVITPQVIMVTIAYSRLFLGIHSLN